MGGQNLMILSPAGDARVAEMDAGNLFIRKPVGKFIYATNHFVSTQMASQRVSCGRYNKLVKALEYKDDALSLEQAVTLVRATAIRGLNLQAMIMRPATLELHLACGKEPAADQPFKVIKLKPYLKPEDDGKEKQEEKPGP